MELKVNQVTVGNTSEQEPSKAVLKRPSETKTSETKTVIVSDKFKKNIPSTEQIKGVIPDKILSLYNSTTVKKEEVKPNSTKPSTTPADKSSTGSGTTNTILSVSSVVVDGASTLFEKFDFIEPSAFEPLKIFDLEMFNHIDLNFLDGFDALGVQSLKMIAGGLRLGVSYNNLKDNIKKGDERNAAWAGMSLAKGTWGLVVGGFKTAEAGAAFGAKVGLSSAQTAVVMSARAKRINNVVDKVAIPFAVAGTGLYMWDVVDNRKKVTLKEKELEQAGEQRRVDASHSKVIKRSEESETEKKLKKEVVVLKTNSKIMGASFAVSAISTGALIASVVYPPSAKITNPIFVVGNVVASLGSTFSDDKVRTQIADGYLWIKNKKNKIDETVNHAFNSIKP